ncbi:MAG: hypothetical protein IKO94_11755, partial [Selenomonadaceae bacterium]|nr:hypothetical protein [Selenomonadaceae bacterium]
MDTKQITIEKILQEILQEDRSILLDHKKLIEKARSLVPPDSMRDFRSIEKAFDNHIGEQLLSSDRAKDKAQRTKTLQNIKLQLRGTGLQEKRADYVIRVLEAALEWDKDPAEEAEPTQPEAPEDTPEEVQEEIQEEAQEEPLPLQKERPSTETDAAVDTTWMCSCGVINDGNFCRHCGKQKLDERSHMFLPGTSSVQEEEQKKKSAFSQASEEVPAWTRLSDLPPQKEDSHGNKKLIRWGILVVLLGCALAFFPQDILER